MFLFFLFLQSELSVSCSCILLFYRLLFNSYHLTECSIRDNSIIRIKNSFFFNTQNHGFRKTGMDQVKICRNIVDGNLTFPKNFNPDCKDLCKHLLVREVQNRMGKNVYLFIYLFLSPDPQNEKFFFCIFFIFCMQLFSSRLCPSLTYVILILLLDFQFLFLRQSKGRH